MHVSCQHRPSPFVHEARNPAAAAPPTAKAMERVTGDSSLWPANGKETPPAERLDGVVSISVLTVYKV